MSLPSKLFVLTFFLLSLNCSAQKANKNTQDSLVATALKPYGRFIINKEQELELISSAVNLGFSFEGKECQIYATIPNRDGHNYVQYELDGIYQKRIRIDGNSKAPIILTAINSGKHNIWLYKATEAHTGPIVIQKIKAYHIKALQRSAAPLIEFIGNSITCGAAADPSEVPCGTGEYHDQHNAYLAYGPRLARELGVNFILNSVSGIGIYRNWNSDGPTMPQVYEKVDFQEQNPQLWNFNTYAPKVVSIALGTNDFSNGDGKKERLPFDSTNFISSYVQFIRLIISKQPDAQVALLSSPMIHNKARQTLQNCLTKIKEQVDILYPNHKPIALFFFEPMQASGCSGHPNVEDHTRLAKQLYPFFEKLVK
jgi:lysophospholipase L1-like esterase